MQEMADNELHEQQTGFQPKHSGVEQIFMLWRIIEKCNELQAPLTISFIDFIEAFDSIRRPSLQNILQAYNIPSRVVTVRK